MQQVQEQLDFKIETPSDKELEERHSEHMEHLDKLNSDVSKSACKTRNQRKRINKKSKSRRY